jgi:uracil-DNA glycosylase
MLDPSAKDPPRVRLSVVHRDLAACNACPDMIGPVVHGPPVMSRIFLLGQAPGPHEGKIGRPFAWTAGKTLFRWFEQALGTPEDEVRKKIYFAAVARCFPGKAKGGGDRRPDPGEIERCGTHLAREIAILRPRLVLPVGTLAIEQVLGKKVPLVEVVGKKLRVRYRGAERDVICLPHPSGASTWHRMQPGLALLGKALEILAADPEITKSFGAKTPDAGLSSPARGKRDFPRGEVGMGRSAVAASVVVLCGVALGCSSYVVSTPAQAPVGPFGEAPIGLAKVCVYRPHELGASLTTTVRDNGKLVGATRGPTFFCYLAKPGLHHLEVERSDADALELEVVSGMKYHVHHEINFGPDRLTLVEEREAREYAAGCAYSVVTDVPPLESIPDPVPVAPAE